MATSTYTELKTAIQNWTKRSDTLSLLDDFIDLAEADINQVLRSREMEAKATETANGLYLALPAGFLSMRKLRLIGGAQSHELSVTTPESMRIHAAAGLPTMYAITSQVEFNRPAADSYDVEISYFKEVTPLSTAAPTNTVLERFPSVYLYGALVHYAEWAIDDAMLMKYTTLFDSAVRKANRLDKRGRYGAANTMRIEGSTP